MANYTVFLTEPEALDVDIVGREAHQLHLLLENAVRVPDGFVITADTLHDFLETSGAGAKLAHMFSADLPEERGLEILSRQAVEIVLGSEMSWDIEAGIIGAYEHLARQQAVGAPKVSVIVSVAFHPERFPYFADTFERRATVHDRHDLDKAVKEAWASLYTPESLRFFNSIGWDLEDVRASVLVQHDIAPEASGVAFTVPDEEAGHDMIIKAVLGSAMALEKGIVEPDTYLVDLKSGEVKDRDQRTQEEFYYPDEAGRMRPIRLPHDLASQPKLPDEAMAELARLSRLALKIFGQPMVLEWALVEDGVWVVNAVPMSAIEEMEDDEEEEVAPPTAAPAAQAPPPTAPIETAPPRPAMQEDDDVMEVLAAMGMATKRRPAPPPVEMEPPAPAVKEFDRVEAEMEPEPEVEPELEPEVEPEPEPEVEPEPEPEVEPEPELEPEVEPEPEPEPVPEPEPEPELETEPVPEPEPEPESEMGTEAETEAEEEPAMRVGGQEVLSPEQLDLGPYLPVTEMQVLVATEDVSVIKDLPGIPITGVRFDDGKYLVKVTEGKHPLVAIDEDADGLVESLTAGQVAMAQASFPQPVYVQLTDLRSDEFIGLVGGEDMEQMEAVPSMGFRGVARLISPEGEPLLRAEAKAIRRARRELHMTNLHVVIPFPRTVDEVEVLYNVLFEEGVRRTGNLRVYIDVSVPSTLLFLHLYSQVSDGFFVRLDELLPSLLSIDPTSNGMRGTGYLTAHEKAVRQAILLVTEAAHQAKKEVIIETAGPLDPGLVEFLLRIGISGICLGVDGLRENVALISEVEHDLSGEGEI